MRSRRGCGLPDSPARHPEQAVGSAEGRAVMAYLAARLALIERLAETYAREGRV